MTSYNSAIGRQQGKADTDNNGLARYMLKIETPAGIKSGNEPDLSLQYSQGTPNGILGFSWVLGGVSSIYLGAPKVVYGKVNPPPQDYDTSTPKLIMDGIDLLNIDGDYNGPQTVYTTEINNTGLQVKSLGEGGGFLVTDNMGRQTEYGTTLDSRIVTQPENKAREWRIKKQTDCHGNTTLYNYITSPQTENTKDVNASYLDSIKYCSNDVTDAPATRFVQFHYTERPDLVKHSIAGAIITWANLLSSISIGINIGGDITVNRTYSLTYGQSATTNDSCLSQVTESSVKDGQTVNLLPASFSYTTQETAPGDLFKTVPADPFQTEANVVTLLPLNMTGKALTDVACMVWDVTNKVMTVKPYTADRKPNPDGKPDVIAEWTPSEGSVQVPMPMWDPANPDDRPDFLTPDLHGDGRSDLIIPYQNANGMLEFFLSQSNGVGLTAVQERKQTTFPWVAKSKFMAMDITGTGVVDVVQIFPNGENLSFRNFPGVADDGNSGGIGLADGIQTDTTYSFDNTIDWFLLKHSGTGAVSLVRVWQEILPDEQYNIKTTSFRCANTGDSSKGFEPNGIVSTLGGPFPKGDPNAPVWSILSCDINGDGTQDIVLGKAEYQAPNMVFKYLVSLGDGMGSFALCGDELSQTVEASEPKGDGRFSVTNLNGGLYPSLAYVYQQSSDSSFVCMSVDGRCDSTVSPIVTYPVMPDPKTENPQVIPTDLSGTGMGGWLFYSITTEGKPSVFPVYNTGQPTDLLSSGNDSMGLVTSFSYGCLTDPDVYDSGVDWRNYTPTDPGNYVVQGAPNYVVTLLKHTNDPDTNSLAFEVDMAKRYRQALVNSQGRGWLGFESITTHNTIDDIWTVEHYFQTFPKTGIKSQIDTFNSDPKADPQPPLLSSQSTDYDIIPSQQNGWDIYHVNKLFDKLETEGELGRVQMTQFTCDNNGNVTTKHVSEKQAGRIIFQSWENCSYISLRGITSLMTAMKLTSVETNRDLNSFQPGDVSFTQYTYNNETALLEAVKRWSDDAGQFLTTTYVFDNYGNEISTTDPAGLTTKTTYDSSFNCLPIQQVEQGRGVDSIQHLAYDMASGELLAKRETNGRLTCTRVDGFGRNIETRMQSNVRGKLSTTAKEFLPRAYVASSDFMKLLSYDCILDPVQQYSYELFKSSGGKSYLTSTTLSYFNDTDPGQHQVVDVVDCVGQKRMQRSRQGVDPAIRSTDTHVTWRYWTYDTRGNPLFESFALQSAQWDNFEYQPQPSEGTTSVFDKLGRVLNQTRPSHNDPTINVVSSLQYSIGGGTVLETITGPDPNTSATNVVLWSAPRTYISINGKEHVISATNQGVLTSEFKYDVSGNLVSASDPQAKMETREYNSLGQLRVLDNIYQSVEDPGSSQRPAMIYMYNNTGQLEKTINANEEAIMFERDSKGRPTSKTGSDGRVLKYEYDADGEEGLSSMTVYVGEAKQLETKLSFKYDERARLSSRTLTLADGVEYETVFKYDWQGQVLSKSYPNGATKLSKYIGSLLSYSEIYAEVSGGQRQTWLDGTFEYNDATEKPNKVIFGKADGQTDFQHTFEYDLQSYPLSHNLDQLGQSPGDTTPLVQEKYVYNGADQLAQNFDALAKVTKKYNYEGKRLKNSQIGDANVNNYEYDPSGNILTKADTTISYGPNSAVGKRGPVTAFNILYDRAGRTIRRETENSSLQLSYDSFGLLASYKDSAGKTTNMTCAPDGKTVKREEPGNGGTLLTISDDYNVQIKKDGSKIITVKLFGAGILIGSCSKTVPSKSGPQTSVDTQASAAIFTDVKGNVTHRFKSTDGSLLETITYDDFGTPKIKRWQPNDSGFDKTSTYESKSLDEGAGLYDFGSRWYDPICGRFTTPDDILAVKDLARTDGLNRLAFENNDPINHTDPSGHWSLSAVLGAVVGAALVVGAIALTVATGGAAAPLAAAAAGALASGGIAGITYSFDHRNERGGKFWGGYAATVLVNAAIGGATGALGAVATPANMVSATGRLGQAVGWSTSTATENLIGAAASIGSKALINATSSLLTTVAHNAIENKFYGTNYGLFEGAGNAFGSGALSGALGGLVSAGSYMIKGESAVAQTSAQKLKNGLMAGALVGARAAYTVAKHEDLPHRAGKWVSNERMEMANMYREQERNFKGLLSMVGPSGFVGTLQNELIKHQSFVNYG